MLYCALLVPTLYECTRIFVMYGVVIAGVRVLLRGKCLFNRLCLGSAATVITLFGTSGSTDDLEVVCDSFADVDYQFRR